MKKMYMLLIVLLAVFTLSACGDDDEPEVTDLATRYIGQSAVMLESQVGQDITINLVEYDSVLATMIMDLESYVDERIAYFFTYEYDDEEVDGTGFGSIYFSFTYDLDEANPIPDGTSFTVTIYEDEIAFDEGKTELTNDIENFMNQSQALADALESDGEDFEFNMDRVTGDFDQAQVEEYIEEYLDPDDDDDE